MKGGTQSREWMLLALLGAGLLSLEPVVVRFGMNGFVLLYAVTTVVWLTLFVTRETIRPISISRILLIALTFRALFLFATPRLSSDVYRYLWDGSVFASGHNPYDDPPASGELSPLRGEWFDRINHPEIRTIYPPLAQGVFLLAGWLGGTLFAWRLLMIGFDLLSVALLARMSAPRTALLYATCPFVLIEGVWSGHVDVAGAALLLLALATAGSGRCGTSGAVLALASGIKVIPLFALPAFLRFGARRLVLTVSFATSLAVMIVPFAMSGDVMPGLRDYATRWSFNSPAHRFLVSLLDMTQLSTRLKKIWTSVKDEVHGEPVSEIVYQHLNDEFLARAALAAVFIAVLIFIVRRSKDLPTAVSDSLTALLLLSPTIHPWYWLTLVPVAMVARRWMTVALAIASPCSYLLYSNSSAQPAVYALCYLAPLLGTLLLGRRVSTTRTSNER